MSKYKTYDSNIQTETEEMKIYRTVSSKEECVTMTYKTSSKKQSQI